MHARTRTTCAVALALAASALPPQPARASGEVSPISWAWIQDWVAYRWAQVADSREVQLAGQPVVLVGYWVGSGAARLQDWLAPDAPPAAAAPAQTAPAGPALQDILVTRPVDAPITSEFGYRRDPFHNRRKRHKGVDFDADRGAPVRAAGAGVVVFTGRRGGYGRLIMIDHGLGVETRYAHLRSIQVEAGAFVTAGAPIGEVGSTGRTTGPHLHFEVRMDGEAIDPRRVLDPEISLSQHLERVRDWLF